MAELTEQENTTEDILEHQGEPKKSKPNLQLVGFVSVFVLIAGILAFNIIQAQQQNAHIQQQNVILGKISTAQDDLNSMLAQEIQMLAEKIQILSQKIADIPPPSEKDENNITRDELQSVAQDLTKKLTEEFTNQIDTLKIQVEALNKNISDQAKEVKETADAIQSTKQEPERPDDEEFHLTNHKSWWQRLLEAFRISRISSPDPEAETQ